MAQKVTARISLLLVKAFIKHLPISAMILSGSISREISSAKLSKGLFTQAVFHIRTTCTTGRLDKSELSIQERTGKCISKNAQV